MTKTTIKPILNCATSKNCLSKMVFKQVVAYFSVPKVQVQQRNLQKKTLEKLENTCHSYNIGVSLTTYFVKHYKFNQITYLLSVINYLILG